MANKLHTVSFFPFHLEKFLMRVHLLEIISCVFGKMAMPLGAPGPPGGIAERFLLPEVFQSRQDFEAVFPPPLGFWLHK
jgi:hypothetical protein